jgi:hypothetical protein
MQSFHSRPVGAFCQPSNQWTCHRGSICARLADKLETRIPSLGPPGHRCHKALNRSGPDRNQQPGLSEEGGLSE